MLVLLSFLEADTKKKTFVMVIIANSAQETSGSRKREKLSGASFRVKVCSQEVTLAHC